ncbi:cysteine desulfurase [Paenibacillus hemerocallicola]|uniref:cysteine desulfurase n=1 Tax=Paenibacillus hemerocallicola TaxID=1172614 RepID=A0A5C4TG96_9BACL|nr:cysteine desulfurase family protein [Paenibacillus hemerocallicola]TNJ67530.1 cysteine desulfurase [Paenibacillus hemerocallicola]
MSPIYLDHAATTPMHAEVLEAMLPYFTEKFGNASSLHGFGRESRIALSRSRDRLAALIGCSPSELVFTSGGTESDNAAIFGAAARYGTDKKHMITTQAEHHAVLHACEQLEKRGYEVTYLPVDEYGQVRMEELSAAIRDDTFLVSVMYGNNEVGTLQPIVRIGELARERGIAFHVDAVQALGLLPIDLAALPVDFMSFSAHKIYGPKGVGALYISGRISIPPYLVGGSQERKRRAGTENVAGIVGFAKAAELAVGSQHHNRLHVEMLRQEMIQAFTRELEAGAFIVNGHPTDVLPHILNVSFPGANTETMLMSLDLEGIAAASGSACTSGSLELSHVLRAMHLPESVMRSAIRFSFGFTQNLEQIRTAAQKTATISRRIRNRN